MLRAFCGELSIDLKGALCQFSLNCDAVRVFGDEGRNASDVCAERIERRGELLVGQLVNAECHGRAAHGSAQAIKREFSLRQRFAARLKVAESVQDDLLCGDGVRFGLRLEKIGLMHRNQIISGFGFFSEIFQGELLELRRG
jgi:hypothetical protein